MNKIIRIIFFFILCISFIKCKKENKINKKMTGTWVIDEYANKNGVVSDFSLEKRSFQFFTYKKAYTRTMKGVYRIDYIDVNKLPVVDTFEYQLKNDEIDITKVQNKKVNGVFSNTFVYLRKRFKIEGYKTNSIKFSRTDSTELYIKATKQ